MASKDKKRKNRDKSKSKDAKSRGKKEKGRKNAAELVANQLDGAMRDLELPGGLNARELAEASPRIVGRDRQAIGVRPDAVGLDALSTLGLSDLSSLNRPISLNELTTAFPALRVAVLGDFDTWVFVVNIDKALVAAELPAGLELKSASMSPAGTHPVICFAGRQSNVRLEDDFSLLGSLLLCPDYLEIAAAVPFVGRAGSGSTVTHFCSTHLFLDQVLPVCYGWLTGLPKQLANVAKTATTIEASTVLGADVFDGTFTELSPAAPVSSFPHFATIRGLFEQVHIGKFFDPTGTAVTLTTSFICVPMDLGLDAATIQPVSAKIDLTNEFFPPMSNHLELNGIDTDPFGAFRLQCSWRMSPPFVC